MKSAPVVGMDAVLDRLTGLATAAGDITPAKPKLSRLWVRRQGSVFDTAGNGKWDGFSLPVIKRGSPLIDEGIMEAGMTLARPRYDDKHMVAFGPPKGNRRVQAIATLNTVGHKSRGSSQVPPRPVTPSLSGGERRQWIGVIEDHIREALD